MAFVNFLAGTTGRMLRIAVGTALIAVGLLGIEGTVGTVLTVIGLVPVLAGTFDVCLVGPLVGAPLSGRAIRRRRAAAEVEPVDEAGEVDEMGEMGAVSEPDEEVYYEEDEELR